MHWSASPSRLSALVGFRFFALQDLVNRGRGAARAGAPARCRSDRRRGPGEGLEHFGRGRFGRDDPNEHGVVERSDDLDDFCGACRTRLAFSSNVSPVFLWKLSANAVDGRQVVLADRHDAARLRSLGALAVARDEAHLVADSELVERRPRRRCCGGNRPRCRRHRR